MTSHASAYPDRGEVFPATDDDHLQIHWPLQTNAINLKGMDSENGPQSLHFPSLSLISPNCDGGPSAVLTSPARFASSASMIRPPPASPDNGDATTSADPPRTLCTHSFVICISSLETPATRHHGQSLVRSDDPQQGDFRVRVTGKWTFHLQP